MIKVIQGLNLQSEISNIVIDINENEQVKEILELIRNFHPIFIDDYKFEDNKLIIESKLPFLWKEVSETLLKLSKEDITYEDARIYIVEEVIKQRVSSMSTIPVLYAAAKKGYEITPTIIIDERVTYTKGFNRHYTIGAGRGSEIVYSISSSEDSKIAKEIQRDKWATNLMIQKLGLPIPKWQVIDNKEQIETVWEEYQKPVVIKPTGLTGGKGVSTGINTIDEAHKAYEWAKEAVKPHEGTTWQEKVMIQEQVPGEDYRLLIVDGKLEIATKRIPAFITGDGKQTIEELIMETNKDPRRDITNPSHTLKPIKIDKPLLDFLQEQNLSLQSIPEQDQRIFVRKIASMSQGGITEDFTDKVGPEIKHIVESISSSIHAFVIGADVLCKDISKPLTKENGAILEVNTMPEAYLNLFPVIGESKEHVADIYIEKLLKNNNTKKIAVIGHITEDIPTLLRQKKFFQSYLSDEDVVGEYQNGEIKINGLDINKDLEKSKAVEALKVNASLDAIIIHHRDWEDVKETGLGFDQIDMLILNKKLTEDRENYGIIKKYSRRNLINKITII